MPSRWVPSTQGEQDLLNQLAAGANDFGEFVRQRVREVEAGLERYHYVNRKHPRNVHYVDTINQVTHLNGVVVGGVDVRGAARPKGDTIHTRVYTTSFLGHMLEVTGAAPHDIPIPIGEGVEAVIIVHHPGFTRRPHFVPGLLSAVSQVGAKMRGRQLAEHGGEVLSG